MSREEEWLRSHKFTLDKLDIQHYGLGHLQVAMSGTRHAGYQNAHHGANRGIRMVSLLIDNKKKLDSEKSGLLSFDEIAVGRAPQVRHWVCEGAVGS